VGHRRPDDRGTADRETFLVLARHADANDAAFFGALSVDDRQALDRILKSLAARNDLRALPTD